MMGPPVGPIVTNVLGNSYICYDQLAKNKLSDLNYLVSVAEFLCSGAERPNLGSSLNEMRHPSSSQLVARLDDPMHLPVIEAERRCAYCNTKVQA